MPQSESYMLTKFWETLDKKQSLNFKLKVTTGDSSPSKSSAPVLQDSAEF